VADEFGRALFQEMDYVNEAENARRFAELYGNVTDVVVPTAVPNLSSRRVLTMQWLEGEKGPWDGQRMVEIGLECSIRQILSQGYFHADPHRGNLIRTREGKLGYLDFGLMATVDETKRNAIVAAAVGLQNQEWRVLAENMQVMGFLDSDADIDEFVEPLRDAFVDAQGGSENAGPRSLSLGKLARNIQQLAINFPIRIPPWYSIILRTLLILEGLAISRDRNFELLESAYPYIIRVLLTSDSPQLQKTLKDVIIYPTNGTLRWSRIRKLLTLSGAATRRNAQEAYQGQGSWSPDTIREAMTFFFSEEGRFLREPLKTEIIEIFDLAQLEMREAVINATRPPGILESIPIISSILADPNVDSEIAHIDYTRLYEARAALGTIAEEILASASADSGLDPLLKAASQSPAQILSGGFNVRDFQEILLSLARGGQNFEPPPRQVVEGILSLGVEVAATLAQRNAERSLEDLNNFLGRLENALSGAK